jgi:plastocyanin
VKTTFWTGATAALVATLLLGGAVAAQSPAAPAASPSASMAPMMTSPAPSGAAAVSSTAVTIANFAFGPASISVPVGSTVTWTNQDSTNHTVTADDGSFDSGPLAPGATFSQTFDTAGTFTYHCAIHSSMKGTITVTAATSASPAPSTAPAA